MIIVSEPIIFEWDTGNFDKNFKKHNVTNQEIEQVFTQEAKFIVEDKKHSEVEKRYALFGITGKGRTLVIVFTLRENKVRVVTARDMSKKERRRYEQIKTNT